MNRDQCLTECISSMKIDISENIRSQLDEIMPALKQALGATFESINCQFEDLKKDILNAIKEQFDTILREKDIKINEL